ncbi:hypothetical protein FEK34_14870 [Nocardia cyriacigeorgica]|uniref:Uncharacterized protein n=1 Tax=Nocardia cyriacigeorgica TaxID=135487 RepID=A0A5R8NPM0_9NOCA|nr:hypothetical protein FEK34_14870 [Nocardia cyriacigeorgica]
MVTPTRPARPRCAPADILDWRRRWLVVSGFPPWLAEAVASDPGSDLLALSQLVDRGCTPELAVRILAPQPGTETPP